MGLSWEGGTWWDAGTSTAICSPLAPSLSPEDAVDPINPCLTLSGIQDLCTRMKLHWDNLRGVKAPVRTSPPSCCGCFVSLEKGGALDTEIQEEGGKGGVNHHCAGPRDMQTLRAWVERIEEDSWIEGV